MAEGARRALYFEDFTPGRRFETRALTLGEAAILDFARRYDPQPFHTDVEAARAGPFGGLIASGFQTLAIAFRLFLDTGAFAACSLGGPGIDEVRWPNPVRPGDTLRVEVEVREARGSRSRPEVGILRLAFTAVNQKGEPVLTMTTTNLVRRRPA